MATACTAGPRKAIASIPQMNAGETVSGPEKNAAIRADADPMPTRAQVSGSDSELLSASAKPTSPTRTSGAASAMARPGRGER